MYTCCKVKFSSDPKQIATHNPVVDGILKISKVSSRKAFSSKNFTKRKLDNTPRVNEYKFNLVDLANVSKMSIYRVDKELQELKVFLSFLPFLCLSNIFFQEKKRNILFHRRIWLLCRTNQKD